MANYYNKSGGPLAIQLRSGQSVCLMAKKWTPIPPHEEGSEDLVAAIKKGFLLRFSPDDGKSAPSAEKPPPTTTKSPTPTVPEVPAAKAVAVEAPLRDEETLAGEPDKIPARKKR